MPRLCHSQNWLTLPQSQCLHPGTLLYISINNVLVFYLVGTTSAGGRILAFSNSLTRDSISLVLGMGSIPTNTITIRQLTLRCKQTRLYFVCLFVCLSTCLHSSLQIYVLNTPLLTISWRQSVALSLKFSLVKYLNNLLHKGTPNSHRQQHESHK